MARSPEKLGARTPVGLALGVGDTVGGDPVGADTVGADVGDVGVTGPVARGVGGSGSAREDEPAVQPPVVRRAAATTATTDRHMPRL
jgi:hypothetical protein